MPMELSIPTQIVFLCALFDFQPESLIPKSIWDAIKNSFRKFNETVSETESDSAGKEKLTKYERKLMTDCIEMLYSKVKTIESFNFVRSENNQKDPRVYCLDRECRIFIGCYNSYLSRLEGKYLDKYGDIKKDVLKIDTVQALSSIITQALVLECLPKDFKKVANNFFNIMNDHE